MANRRREDNFRILVRGFVDTFAPLRVAMIANDCFLYVIRKIAGALCWLFRWIYDLIYSTLKQVFKAIVKLFSFIPVFQRTRSNNYQRLDKKRLKPTYEPGIPYRNQPIKRSLTYHGGLLLGALLYLFVYYVLFKHHTYVTITLALVLMLAYLVVLENSHSIRSILMLCLPIMFTNRGRALVFCCMLAIMVSGPMKNSQLNIGELHLSLNCCKQYLIIKTDKFVDKNIVQGLVRIEEIIKNLVDEVKKFANELKERFKILLQLAISVEQYIAQAIEKLKEIVNVCNVHTKDVYTNCIQSMNFAYLDCKTKLGSNLDILCEIVSPLVRVCELIETPTFLCKIPRAVVDYLDQTIGVRLRAFMLIIENEFYVDIDITHKYSFNGTKSKSFKTVAKEIKFDMERKFWYVSFVSRVFNLISLILVCWILITATLYHMHFLSEANYDNMYLDSYLQEIENFRKRRTNSQEGQTKEEKGSNLLPINYEQKTINSARDNLFLERNSHDSSDYKDEDQAENDDDDEDEEDENERDDEVDEFDLKALRRINQKSFLFPMTAYHEKQYLRPFSVCMNEEEVHKFYIAGLIWLIIVGYIGYFVLLDFALFQLLELVNSILKEVLFTSDLPLIDVSSKSGSQIVHYNRTYLAFMRAKSKAERSLIRNTSSPVNSARTNRSLSTMYRRLMDSIEEQIPDDVAILDSLEQCLPNSSEPNYATYELLGYLAGITFAVVILEAYALRTRHCIANLYYPVRAKKRAVWFYRKLIAEKPKFADEPKDEEGASDGNSKVDKGIEVGLRLFKKRVKR